MKRELANNEPHGSDSRDQVAARNHNRIGVPAVGMVGPSPSRSTPLTSPSPGDDVGFTERPTLTVEETANLLGISRWLV
jgi:hypothetical protein